MYDLISGTNEEMAAKINAAPIEQVRECYRGITGLENDSEFTDEQIREYVIDALWEN